MRLLPGTAKNKHLARSGERGVILILTMFVLFLVIALITQLSLGAEVAHQATSNRANHLRMSLACRSTAEELLTLLKDDASGEASSGFSGALSGPSAFPGMDAAVGGDGADFGASQGSGQDGGEGEEGAEDEEDASNSDSFEDGWAKPMRVMVDDIEITTFVSDENGKFNLHLLLVEDEIQAEENFERAVRILGALRNDFDDDLGESDARAILDELLRWMQVDSRYEELPLMPRHSLDEDSEYTMLSALEEMLLLESVNQELFYDQLRDNELIAPGLESIFTIWTVPAFDQAGVNTLDSDNSTGAASAEGSGDLLNSADTQASGSAAGVNSGTGFDGDGEVQGEGGMQGVLEGSPPIGTLINLNTAPRAVIEGMFPSVELPPVKVTALLEYRNEVDESALEERDGNDEDPDDRELRESIYGEYEPEPKQFFRSLEQISEVDGFSADELQEETQTEIQGLLGVQSDIFSVYIIATRKLDSEWEPSRRYQEAPGKAMRLKAVVWRRTTDDGVKMIYLEPWHEVPYTRWRIPDFQRDLPPFEAPSYR